MMCHYSPERIPNIETIADDKESKFCLGDMPASYGYPYLSKLNVPSAFSLILPANSCIPIRVNTNIIKNNKIAKVVKLKTVRIIVSINNFSCTLPLISLNTLRSLKVLNGDSVILNPISDCSLSSNISTRLIMTITRSNILKYSAHYFSKPNAIILTNASIAKIVVNS